MNQKKAKALRKFLRNTEVDFREAEYQGRIVKRVLVPVGDSLLAQDRIQIRLHPESGRAAYRRLKPLWA